MTKQDYILHEKEFVEEPFLSQLESQEWKLIRLLSSQTPKNSFRESFSDVVLLPELKKSLIAINPWLEEDQLAELIRRITSFGTSSLIEANKTFLQLLTENTSTDVNRQTGEASPTVRYIDFKNIGINAFLAVSQMKIRVPGTDNFIYPDIVLFVNGLPLVVVECKSPKKNNPIGEAIEDLMDYSGQSGESYKKSSNQQLFYYNQFIVATDRNKAKFGTITTKIEKYFYRWTDPYPYSIDDLEHGDSSPNEQQRLILGMLSHDNLLSIIKSFTIFSTNSEGKSIKIVGRYQQFRAVKKSVQKLLNGNNRLEKSGIIWHTQGSGKSLTMMFMVREMYNHEQLRKYKVLFITDRTQLEDQLNTTSQSIGFTVNVADSVAKLKECLRTDSSDLVMGMIHKFQPSDLEIVFPILNPSPNILIMIDEAHRSIYKKLGANLDKALPNSARIAYTGTPTDKVEKEFKDYIDKYTMRQAIDDGVTLEIVYEGRTHKAQIDNKPDADKRFEDVFSDYNIEERLQILGFGTRDAYLEAQTTIEAKASDIINHYIFQVFPNGFKAQIVANSRDAAARYKSALEKAINKEIEQLRLSNPFCIDIDTLRKLEIAVVISGLFNDKPHIKPFTSNTYHEKSIASFKIPYNKINKEENIDGNIGIIVVNNMLLTGFDAPIEQVLYIDRIIKAHNLLQAVARVNRIEENKTKGFIVDYVGIGHHLKEALDDYDEREQKEIIDTFGNEESELNDLILAHSEIWEFVKKHGITDLSDMDAIYDLFYDEDVRFQFMLAFQKFSKSLDSVFPRKEALEYYDDFKLFSAVNIQAGAHFKDDRLSMKSVPEKLRIITDEYLVSKGVYQKIKPIEILDDRFMEHVQQKKRAKTKASEIEHAIRHHININYNEDPELHASFAESLSNILEEFKSNWEMIYKKLEELRERMKNAKKEPNYGLHIRKEMPIFRKLKSLFFEDKDLDEDSIAYIVNLTQLIFIQIESEIRLQGFWNSTIPQNKLKASIQDILISPDFKQKYPEIFKRVFEERNKFITELILWAKDNHFTIITED